MERNQWARLLAYVTGLVNQELLLQNEYLAAENRVLRGHLPARLRLSDPERRTLAEIGKRLGRKALEKVACAAKPDTIPAWYRGSSPASSMAPNVVSILAAPGFPPRWRNWWFASPARTRVGVTTASWGRWPTWVIIFRTRLWAISYAATTLHPLLSGVKRRLGRNSSAGIWTCSPEPTSSRSRC